MSDGKETAPGSPAAENLAGQPPENGEQVTTSLVDQCIQLANVVVTEENDYSKRTTVTQLKATLTEKDDQLKLLAKEFLKQNAKVKRLQRTVLATTKKLSKAEQSAKEYEQSAKEYTVKSEKLTEALVASSLACSSALSSMSSPRPDPNTKEDSGRKDPEPELAPEPAPVPAPIPEPEPRSLFAYREYQDKVKSLDLDNLDMHDEADSMVPPDLVEIDDGAARYEVPMHLMGVVMGRQKVALHRMINQSKTEIEPLSWVANDERVMGFSILGSDDAIRHAVTLMIDSVRKMSADRARKLLEGHLRSEARKPNQRPSAGPSSGASGSGSGSKSAKLCDKFSRGKCSLGNKCRFQHKKNSKK